MHPRKVSGHCRRLMQPGSQCCPITHMCKVQVRTEVAKVVIHGYVHQLSTPPVLFEETSGGFTGRNMKHLFVATRAPVFEKDLVDLRSIDGMGAMGGTSGHK